MLQSSRLGAPGTWKDPALAHILTGRGSTVKLSVIQYQPIVATGAPPHFVMRQAGSRCDAAAAWRGRRGRCGGVGPILMSRLRQLVPKIGRKAGTSSGRISQVSNPIVQHKRGLHQLGTPFPQCSMGDKGRPTGLHLEGYKKVCTK